jgi:hypothetical protein
MIYRFRSKATGDLVMMGPVGDRILRLMGREPAPQGIIEAAALPAAIAALEQAVAADEAGRGADAGADTDDGSADGDGGATAGGADKVSLRQRAWPLLEMMRRSQREGHDLVWGV